ncbi:MAG: sugar-binding protein, partial [bacterium]|nr:sugar-binding protein [bacterium]
MIYPNGTLTEYGYDEFNRVVRVENRSLGGTVLSSFTYSLGSKGERLGVRESSGRSVDYSYDARGQLTEERITAPDGSVQTLAYTYDPAGNRLTKNDNGTIISYTYDDNDRLLTEGEIAYTYDNNGNLLSRNGPGLEQRFSYNALNQLVHVEITGPQGTSTVAYAYDHDGIRVSKTIDGRDEVRYLVDANRPYAQVIEEAWTRGGLSAVTNYIYGHGLVSQSIDGVNRFYHYDGFHNTRSLTDMDGAVTDTYRYDAYGTLQEQNGNTQNPYLYRGEQFDPETDSYYLRARYYQPGTGRFSSTDPFEGETSDPMSL